MEGVGDDLNSYAFDGYRICCWHKDPLIYGYPWDYGDVVGACIDLDKGEIEYFINGESLGIAYNKLQLGKNAAYFPGISFGKKEKCLFNFGGLPFYHSYKGYQPIDLPFCVYNNNFEVTSVLLNTISNSFFQIFGPNSNANQYHKMVLNQKLLTFLIEVSFKDFFLCKSLIFPFLINLLRKSEEDFNILIKQIKKNRKMNNRGVKKYEFFCDFLDKIANIIEEVSLMGKSKINEYKNYMNLFIHLIKNKGIFRVWIKNQNFLGQISYLLTSSSFHLKTIYDNIKKTNQEKYRFYPSNKLVKKLVKGEVVETKEMLELEETYLQYEKMFYKTFFEMGEATNNLNYCLYSIFDLMSQCYTIDVLNHYGNLSEVVGDSNKRNSIGVKNVIISYFSYFLEEFGNIPVHSFPLGSATVANIRQGYYFGDNQYLADSGIPRCFFNEDNIGGNLLSVLRLVPINTKEIFKGTSLKPSLHFNLVCRLLSLVEKFFKAYDSIYSYCKGIRIEDYQIGERGNWLFNFLYRTFFYVFNTKCQIILFKMSYFFIEWIYYVLTKKNEDYIFILPLSIIDFPFEVIKKIVMFKTKILEDKNFFETEINTKDKNYNDYLVKMIEMYLSILLNKKIKGNVLLMTSLLKKLVFFLKKDKISQIILSNPKYVNQVMQALVNSIEREEYSKYVVKIIGRLVTNSCFHSTIVKKEKILANPIEIFKNQENENLFKKFIISFSNYLNKKMTNYILNLEYCKDNLIDKNFVNDSTHLCIISIKKAFLSMCICINIYEFGIKVYPQLFFDKTSIYYLQFKSFLVNLSSRIINEPYITYITTIFNHYKHNSNLLLVLGFSVMGLFLSLKDTEHFDAFLKVVTEVDEIFVHPFIDLEEKMVKTYEFVKAKKEKTAFTNENEVMNTFQKYKEVCQELEARRPRKSKEENLKNLPIDEANEDKLCILCFNNIANKMMIPCKHVACQECLMQYMIEKTICFICHREIQRIEDNENLTGSR